MKIVNQNTIQAVGVTHDPDIKKKVLISKGEIHKLMMFGSATFKPGQKVTPHSHETMTEVFYIQKGKALFTVNGEDHILEKGHCIKIEAKELHSQENPFKEPVEWLYFGIALD